MAPRSEPMEEGIWAVGDYRPKAQGVKQEQRPCSLREDSAGAHG